MLTCGNCGRDSPDGAKFCMECAAPLDAPPSRPVAEERKVVTYEDDDEQPLPKVGDLSVVLGGREAVGLVADRDAAEVVACLRVE